MTQYVIVLEVDNKDAVTKYTEGLRGLDAIWDRVIKEAKRRDDATEDRYEKAVAEYDAKQEARKNSMFYMMEQHPIYFKGFHSYVGSREIERADLIHKLDIAKTAISPFKMTEGDVSLMNRWGDGKRVTELIKEYGLL